MATIREVLTYICSIYPRPEDLSKARVAKIFYLSDWKSSLISGRQITEISWYFDHFGPYVAEIGELAAQSDEFFIESTNTFFGNKKEIIRVVKPADPGLCAEDRKVIDFVIEKTYRLAWGEFIHLVYSTYPVVVETQYSSLDLLTLAARYKAEKLDSLL